MQPLETRAPLARNAALMCNQSTATSRYDLEELDQSPRWRGKRDLEEYFNAYSDVCRIVARLESLREDNQQEVATSAAFDKLDKIKIDDSRAALNELRSLEKNDIPRVYKRIHSIIEAAEEEYPDEELVSAASIRGFAKFLKSEHQWIYPTIVVSSRGNISIEWLKDKNNHVTIEFLGQTTAKIVMLVPDLTVKSKVVPVVTKPRIESIVENLKPFGVLEWITV